MKKQHLCISLLALLCSIVTSGISSAASFTVTWKNQLGESSCTPLEISVKSIMGDFSSRDTNKLSVGDSRTMTVNSSACNSIEVSANCTYSDKSVIKSVLLRAKAQCGNSMATIVSPETINVQTQTINGTCRPWCIN
jgi:hypothetical protein